MIPQRIDPSWSTTQVCDFATRWMIDWTLAARLAQVAALVPFPLSIISGWRSCEHQEQLRKDQGNAAPCDRSTHTSCPATGADLWPGVAASDTVKIELGKAITLAGLRWGGGAAIDPRTGIPGREWNHADLGRRAH